MWFFNSFDPIKPSAYQFQQLSSQGAEMFMIWTVLKRKPSDTYFWPPSTEIHLSKFHMRCRLDKCEYMDGAVQYLRTVQCNNCSIQFWITCFPFHSFEGEFCRLASFALRRGYSTTEDLPLILHHVASLVNGQVGAQVLGYCTI